MISGLEQIANASLKFIEKRIDKAAQIVASAVSNITIDPKVFDKQTLTLGTILKRIEDAVSKLKDPNVTVDLDTSALAKDLAHIGADIKKAMPKHDLSKIETALKMIHSAVKDNSVSDLIKEIRAVGEAVKGLKLQTPGTFKLDDMQMRALSNVGGGGGMRSLDTPTMTTIANVSATATDTQYTYTFPARTSSFSIKLRDLGTLSYYAWATGTLPTVGGGGDGSNYVTISQGFVRSADSEYGGKTIYLGAESATQVFEIESYHS